MDEEKKEEITLSEISRILREERNNKGVLVDLGEDFLKRVRKYLEDKYQELEAVQKELLSGRTVRRRRRAATRILEEIQREIDNFLDRLEDLFTVRCKKIVGKVLLMVSREVFDEKALINALDFEKEVARNIFAELMKYKEIFLSAGAEFGSQEKEDYTVVRIIKEVSETFKFNDKEYGPFGKGEVVSLPRRVAEILVAKGYAEVVKRYEASKES